MSASHVFLYRQVRQALLSGRYIPGQRLDPATLASEFDTSPTPVRVALYRLVGEGLLEVDLRTGLYVPLPTEVALRDLYDWMERLLVIACEMGFAARSLQVFREIETPSPEQDLVRMTWQLFDTIGGAAGQRFLYLDVKRTNNKLAPIRRAKHGIIENDLEELSELIRHWNVQDVAHLESALRRYHERRKKLVPSIVAMLTERRDQLLH